MLKAAWPKRRAEGVPTLPRSIPTCAAHPLQTSLACPPALSSSAASPPSPPFSLSPPARARGRCWSPSSSDLKAHAQKRSRSAGAPQSEAAPGLPSVPPCRFTSVFPSALDAVTWQGREAGLGCALLPAEGLGGFVPHLFPLLRLCVRVSHGSPGTERRSPESLGKGLSLPISCPWSSGQCSPL